jgi:DNA-binding HxlR family transcriptional regulator
VTTKRTYGDGCAIAHGLDLVGERWALLVVRELLLGPKRFTDLKNGLPNASPNVISERLRELEQTGIVRRDKLPPPASSHVYELTEWGHELEDTVISLGRWATGSPSLPREAPIGADSVMLAVKAQLGPGAAEQLRATYELRLGEDRFHIAAAADPIKVGRGGIDDPDATINADPGKLFAALANGRSLADAQRSQDIRIDGDTAAVDRLVDLVKRV